MLRALAPFVDALAGVVDDDGRKRLRADPDDAPRAPTTTRRPTTPRAPTAAVAEGDEARREAPNPCEINGFIECVAFHELKSTIREQRELLRGNGFIDLLRHVPQRSRGQTSCARIWTIRPTVAATPRPSFWQVLRRGIPTSTSRRSSR